MYVINFSLLQFCIRIITAPCNLVQSTVLRLHVVHLSVCNVGGSRPHRLEVFETICMAN